MSTSSLALEAKELAHQHAFKLSKSKLSHITTVMSFMCWFCMLSITQIPVDRGLNTWLLTSYVVTTCILVGLSGFVIMTTAFILPYISANDALDEALVESGLDRIFHYHRKYQLERSLRRMIQLTWILASTGSILLFTLDIILLCWVKFSHSPIYVPASGTGILTPLVILLLIFGVYFRRRLMNNKLFDQVSTDEDDDQTAYRIYQYQLTKQRAPRASVQIVMAVLGVGSSRGTDRTDSISDSRSNV